MDGHSCYIEKGPFATGKLQKQPLVLPKLSIQINSHFFLFLFWNGSICHVMW